MLSHLKLATLAVTMALVAALLASSPASAAPKEYLKISASSVNYNPTYKQKVTLSGRVATHKKHSIRLQSKRSGHGWSKGAVVRTDKYGKFRIRVGVSSKAGVVYFRGYDAKAKSKSSKTTRAVKLRTKTPFRGAFSDRFDSKSLVNKWGYRYLGSIQPGSSRFCSKSATRAVKYSSGKLHLYNRPSSTSTTTAAEERACASTMQKEYKAVYGSKKYKSYTRTKGKYGSKYWARIMDSGHVGTASAQRPFTLDLKRPGIASARIKFAKPRGQHGAFWMRPVKGSTSHEIDIAEYMGYNGTKNSLYQFMYTHAKNTKKVGGTGTKGILTKIANQKRPYSAYRTYSVEWNGKGSYVWRVDGKKTFSTRQKVSPYKHELILSQLTSDYELPRLSRTKAGNMSVDWVKAWVR